MPLLKMFQMCSVASKLPFKYLPTNEQTEQAVAHPHSVVLFKLKEEVQSDTHYKN